MVHSQKDAILKTEKTYLHNIISNLIFFGIYLWLYSYDVKNGAMFVGYSTLYFLLFPFYGAIYGWYSYWRIRTLFKPSIILFLSSCIIQFIGMLFFIKGNFIIWIILSSGIVAFFSLLAGIITRAILKKSKE